MKYCTNLAKFILLSFRKVFAEFDHHLVAKMEEKDIMDITFDKELMLAECRVRCIVDNAKCIQKVILR